MSTTSTALRTTIINAVRASQDAADSAGIGLVDWGSTTVPHVVPWGTIGSVNRGRLPVVEVGLDSQDYDGANAGSGMVASIMTLRIHAPGSQGAAAFDQGHAILSACMAALRETDHAIEGVDTVQTEQRGVAWQVVTAQCTIQNTYQDDYER